MNEAIIPILFGILFLVIALYNARIYISFKKGTIKHDAVISALDWKPKSFYVKFDYLYDTEVAVISYTFQLDTNWYEKTEEVFMQFKKGTIHKRDTIKIYIPKNRDVNNVTIIDPFKNKIRYMVFVSLMGIIAIAIGCLVL